MQCLAEMWAIVFLFAGGCGCFISWFGCNAITRSHRSSRLYRRKKKRPSLPKQLARRDDSTRLWFLQHVAGLRLSLEQGKGQGEGFRRCDQIGIANPLTSILFPFAKGRGGLGTAKQIGHDTGYDWKSSDHISFSYHDWLVVPNKLRRCFAPSILRAGCGMADQNWSTHVSDSQGDADRRGNSS